MTIENKTKLFQNLSFDLLRDLYTLDGLTPTREMITSALSNYLPRVDEVFKVIYYYKEQPRIIKFLDENKDLIEEVKIEEERLKEELRNSVNDDKPFGNYEEEDSFIDYPINIMNHLKSKSLNDLENLVASKLNEVFDENNIFVSIKSISKIDGYPHNEVSLTLTVGGSNRNKSPF